MDAATIYFRVGDQVGSRTVGPVHGPYTASSRLPEGAQEISREEYLAAMEAYRARAQEWRTAQADKVAATRAGVYAEARELGFSEEAARAISGHDGG
jgi:hypothetical protein